MRDSSVSGSTARQFNAMPPATFNLLACPPTGHVRRRKRREERVERRRVGGKEQQ